MGFGAGAALRFGAVVFFAALFFEVFDGPFASATYASASPASEVQCFAWACGTTTHSFIGLAMPDGSKSAAPRSASAFA